MLTRIEIGGQPHGQNADDVAGVLLGCHQRIRHFTALALKLSQPEAPAEQVRAAAAAVYRYYSQALPLHEADENDSVYPRLRVALAAPPNVAAATAIESRDDAEARQVLNEANEAMVNQHRLINARVADLLPRWRTLAAGGAPALDAAETQPLVQDLHQAWQAHLELEERLIFPAIERNLSAGDRDAIRAEMQARRQPPPEPS